MREFRAKPVVEALTQSYKEEATELKSRGIYPALAIVRVGRREDDLAYERGIIKRFEAAQCKVNVNELPEDVPQDEVKSLLLDLDKDEKVHGILMFRPLPEHLDENELRNLVSARKDADCMSDLNMAHVFAQDGVGYPPCTPEAVVEMLRFYEVPLTGKRVTVVGRSMVVGKPLAMLLLKENATVTVCHTRTADLEAECRRADIICAAAGVPRMIGPSYVREGQIIMDVGINMVDGKLCGDVDFDAVAPVVDAITPVPGGVGGVTTAMLLKHVIASAKD